MVFAPTIEEMLTVSQTAMSGTPLSVQRALPLESLTRMSTEKRLVDVQVEGTRFRFAYEHFKFESPLLSPLITSLNPSFLCATLMTLDASRRGHELAIHPHFALLPSGLSTLCPATKTCRWRKRAPRRLLNSKGKERPQMATRTYTRRTRTCHGMHR